MLHQLDSDHLLTRETVMLDRNRVLRRSWWPRVRAVLLLVGCCLAAAPATGTPIVWTARGRVDQSTIPSVNLGDAVSVILGFDTATPDADPSPTCGLYHAITSVTVAAGSRTFRATSGWVEVSLGRGACGAMPIPGVTFRSWRQDGWPSGAGNLNLFFEWGTLASDSLPVDPLDPVAFNRAGVYLAGDGMGERSTATIDDARVVPEPTSLVLIGTGLTGVGALLARTRRRR